MNDSVNRKHVTVTINGRPIDFSPPKQTGEAIKLAAGIDPTHLLLLELDDDHPGPDEYELVRDDQHITLEEGQRFVSSLKPRRGATVSINDNEYTFANRRPTGLQLKEAAGIPSTDVLFLDRDRGDDNVITNSATVRLKAGQHFHSAPPANYGRPTVRREDVGYDSFELVEQPDGWSFLLIDGYPLSSAFTPAQARLLVKLPPQFPDAAPDMFWLWPHVMTAAGSIPVGTSTEPLLEQEWQRFSWHLQPGAWRPGISTLRDYMRCVRARIEKGD